MTNRKKWVVSDDDSDLGVIYRDIIPDERGTELFLWIMLYWKSMISPSRLKRMQDVISQRQKGLVVVLENIADPHNAAAVLRSCDAFGVQDIYFIFEKEPPFDPRKIGKSTSSSAKKWLSYHTFKSTTECLTELKSQGYTLYGTLCDEHTESIYERKIHEPNVALLLGNEHAGLSEEAIRMLDVSISIPMRGFVQSFNLSVTAGILLFEITRQRMEQNMLVANDTEYQEKLLADFLNR